MAELCISCLVIPIILVGYILKFVLEFFFGIKFSGTSSNQSQSHGQEKKSSDIKKSGLDVEDRIKDKQN